MDGGGVGVGVGVGADAKSIKVESPLTRPDQGFNLDPDVSVSSPVTRQKAAKQLIENHYKNYLQGLQDRKERKRALQRRAAEAQVSSEEEEQMLRNLEKKETEYMRLQTLIPHVALYESLMIIFVLLPTQVKGNQSSDEEEEEDSERI